MLNNVKDGLIAGWEWTDDKLSELSESYRKIVWILLAITIPCIWIGLALNQNGLKEYNLIFSAIVIVVWLTRAFTLEWLFRIFGLGVAASVLFNGKSWKVPGHTRAAVRLVEQFIALLSLAAVILICFFNVISVVSITQVGGVWLFLVGLVGSGIWAWSYRHNSTLLKRWTFRILMASIIIGIISATLIVVHPQDKALAEVEQALVDRTDGQEGAELKKLKARVAADEDLTFDEYTRLDELQQNKKDRGVVGQAENAFFDTVGGRVITKTVEVRSFDTQKVCGIPVGNRNVTVDYQMINIDGTDYALSAFVTINDVLLDTPALKARSAGKIRVNGSGCVKLSFAFTSEGKAVNIQPQNLIMKFE